MIAAPVVVRSRAELRAALGGPSGSSGSSGSGGSGGPVALVPTMGALHEGHASLVRTARERSGPAGTVVVSVFVNPMQFAPGEDLDRYPRTLEADLGLCAREGVDVVLHPGVEEVYPGGAPQVSVDPGPLATELEGASRPTHFHGVLTVVAKLLGLVGPDLAVFGEKDYQQLALVRRMAADLCLPVEVVGSPTVREADGLAMSSRNRFLEPAQRASATALSRALRRACEVARSGAAAVLEAAGEELDVRGVELDYLELRSPDLGPAPAAGPARLLVAARVGATRLLDNTELDLGPSPGPRPATTDGGNP